MQEIDREQDHITRVWYRLWVCTVWPDHPFVRKIDDDELESLL
jgi:hypothetical protein